MITILLQKILAALTQLLGDIKTKLNTIKDNLDNLIVMATAAGPIASFTTNLSRPLLACIVDVPESISGTDTVIITQTGKNLFNPSISSNINTSIKAWASNDTNIVAFLNTLKKGTYKLSYKIKVDAINGSGADSYGIIIAPSSGAHINARATESNVSVGSIFERNAIITIGEGTTFTNVWFYTGRSPATSADSCTFYDFQLEVGNTQTTYEPYSATTKTVSLPSTVYGGEVDIISGNIIKTYDVNDLGDLAWFYESDEGYFYSDSITDIKSGSENCLCESGYTYDAALSVDKTFTVSGTQIKFRDDTYSSTPDFKTAVTGIDFIYELAEADTDSITPEVITAINGVNNIFSDSGNVTVEYLKLYKEV